MTEEESESQAAKDAARRPAETALFISAFFDELRRNGVRDAVVSPGSRSTALAMVAYESTMNVYVDIDERGAAFFALGLSKANGRPTAVIATSGTAIDPQMRFPGGLLPRSRRQAYVNNGRYRFTLLDEPLAA